MDLIVHLSQFYHVSDINIVADEPFPHELWVWLFVAELADD